MPEGVGFFFFLRGGGCSLCFGYVLVREGLFVRFLETPAQHLAVIKRQVGAVETEIENNIESIIMSLYETGVYPRTVFAVLALFIIKKTRDIKKLRKCVENSDRMEI